MALAKPCLEFGRLRIAPAFAIAALEPLGGDGFYIGRAHASPFGVSPNSVLARMRMPWAM